jgi:hypothetical protein
MSNPELPTEQLNRIPRGISEQAFVAILESAGLPLQDWGQGSSKTVGHLLAEVRDGESLISVGRNGEIRREVDVVGVDVLHVTAGGDVYLLREDRQVYKKEYQKDKRVRQRNLSTSLGEKIKLGEDPVDAANRSLSEELGVAETTGLYSLGFQETIDPTDSYPGLVSQKTLHLFVAQIPAESFVPEGYVEKQGDKTNYYLWDLMHKAENDNTF